MITIGIFCFNEEMSIENTIDRVTLALQEASILNYEILVINDGSTDGSLKKIKRKIDLDSRIRVINNLVNFGIAESAKLIAKHSTNEVILLVPGDDTYDSVEYLKIIKEYQKNVLVKNLSVIGIREGKDPRGFTRSLFSFMARQLLLIHDFSKIIIPNYILILTTKKHLELVPFGVSGYAQGTGLFGTILMVGAPIKYVKIKQLYESGKKSKKVQVTDVKGVFRAHLLLLKYRNGINKKRKDFA